MDTQHQSDMENTTDYKYYLVENTISKDGVRTVKLYKLRDDTGEGEELVFTRGRDTFSLTRSPIKDTSKNENPLTEIEEFVYEIILSSGVDSINTFDRLLSYFDNERSIFHNLPAYFTKRDIFNESGIPVVEFNREVIPEALKEYDPYIFDNMIIATPESILYLAILREKLKKEINRNSVWMISGINTLLDLMKKP